MTTDLDAAIQLGLIQGPASNQPSSPKSPYSNLNEGDRNLRLALDALSQSGTDTSGVDWQKIPEGLRNYIRGGGQVPGKLSDFQTSYNQMAEKQTQLQQQNLLQGLFPQLTQSQNPFSGIPAAIQPLLEHIHQQQDTRRNQFDSMINNYLSNTRFPPGIKELLQGAVPMIEESQRNVGAATEAAALQQPALSQLQSQLAATQKAYQKASSGAATSGGLSSDQLKSILGG